MNDRKGRRGNGSLERFFPVGLVAVVLLAGLVLLPSALRPPNQQPNETAELSPDAPPDNNPQAIIAALNRGASGVGSETAGGTPDGGPPPLVTVPTTRPLPPQPPTTFVPRACPKGIGDPPRQVESIFSAACAGPFTGANGGKTYRGVSANEIRIGVRSTGNRGGSNDCGTNGEIDSMTPATMDAATRTFYVLEKYFNANFQFYGRQLKFICIEPESLSVADEQAAAIDADAKYGIYGSAVASSIGCDEFARRKIISMCEGLPDSTYSKNDPYMWSSYYGSTEGTRYLNEYFCKKLAGKPAKYAGTADLQGTKRKLGVITYNDRGYGDDATFGKKLLKEMCGEDEILIFMTPAGDSADGNAALAQAATQMKAAGVTTILPAMDFISTSALTNAAQGQGYFPEWFVSDYGAISQNQLGGLMNQAEWKNAFGVTSLDAQRPDSSTECFRAYRSLDPANAPNYVLCNYVWRNLMLFISSIQEAGPNLSPTTQKAGFYKLTHYWKSPNWALGGDYKPGKWTYGGDIVEIWWDTTATEPGGHSVGAYRYTHNGRRECPGALTDELIPFVPTDAPALVPDYNEPAIGSVPTCLAAHPIKKP